MFGSFSFSGSNRTRGLFMKHFVFSFKPAADGGAAHGPTTTVFCTMNATVYWRFDCSPQYQILSHSSVDAPTIVLLLQSELLYFSTGMSRAHVLCSCCCSFWQSLDCFRSSNTFIAPALESYRGGVGGRCSSGPEQIQHVVASLCLRLVLSVGF